MTLHFTGLLLGICTFLIIGLFHPVVVKFHYWFGTRCWWWFIILGLAATAASLFVEAIFPQTLLGVFAFSSFWTSKEIFEQQGRVERGWFPANPLRNGNQTVISPQRGWWRQRATWRALRPVPKRNIILVRAASVVMSWPEITPARSRRLPV